MHLFSPRQRRRAVLLHKAPIKIGIIGIPTFRRDLADRLGGGFQQIHGALEACTVDVSYGGGAKLSLENANDIVLAVMKGGAKLRKRQGLCQMLLHIFGKRLRKGLFGRSFPKREQEL